MRILSISLLLLANILHAGSKNTVTYTWELYLEQGGNLEAANNAPQPFSPLGVAPFQGWYFSPKTANAHGVVQRQRSTSWTALVFHLHQDSPLRFINLDTSGLGWMNPQNAYGTCALPTWIPGSPLTGCLETFLRNPAGHPAQASTAYSGYDRFAMNITGAPEILTGPVGARYPVTIDFFMVPYVAGNTVRDAGGTPVCGSNDSYYISGDSHYFDRSGRLLDDASVSHVTRIAADVWKAQINAGFDGFTSGTTAPEDMTGPDTPDDFLRAHCHLPDQPIVRTMFGGRTRMQFTLYFVRRAQ